MGAAGFPCSLLMALVVAKLTEAVHLSGCSFRLLYLCLPLVGNCVGGAICNARS
jgi:hypothetical protein